MAREQLRATTVATLSRSAATLSPDFGRVEATKFFREMVLEFSRTQTRNFFEEEKRIRKGNVTE
jgi:hypothetical protein